MAVLTTSLWSRCDVILSYDPPASLSVAFWAESTFGDKTRAEISPRWFTHSFKMFLRLRRGVITGQYLVAGRGRAGGGSWGSPVSSETRSPPRWFVWRLTRAASCFQTWRNILSHTQPRWPSIGLTTRGIYRLLTGRWRTRLTRGDLSPRAWGSRLCRADMLLHLFGSVAMCEHLRNRHHAPCGVKYQRVWHTQS